MLSPVVQKLFPVNEKIQLLGVAVSQPTETNLLT